MLVGKHVLGESVLGELVLGKMLLSLINLKFGKNLVGNQNIKYKSRLHCIDINADCWLLATISNHIFIFATFNTSNFDYFDRQFKKVYKRILLQTF